jgi:hypothetical protein
MELKKRKCVKKIKNKRLAQLLSDSIGEETEELCPSCSRVLIANRLGDKWCKDCTWANTQEMIDFKVSLHKSPELSVSGESNTCKEVL